jgi:hypothetical protein
VGETRTIQYSQKDWQASFQYESSAKFPFEIVEELSESLASLLGNKIDDRSEQYRGGFAPFPWVELTLVFASSTVATTMLNKFGEDIYNLLKSKITGVVSHKARKQIEGNKHQFVFPDPNSIRATITIYADTVVVSGEAQLDNPEAFAHSMKNAKQIMVDVHEKRGKELEELQQAFNQNPHTSQQEPCLLYVYDSTNKQWISKGFKLVPKRRKVSRGSDTEQDHESL